MRVWDDYVEIWNEGELPMGLTPELLLKKHSSHPRNKNIAYAFFKAGFIESWGRGYEKIRKGFESAGLPMPKIETVEGGVRVTFKRKNVGNSAQTLPELRPNSAQTLPEQILQLIQENPMITKGELAKRIGRGERTIQDYLHKLKAENRIRRIGSATFGGHWEITEKKE